jgi:hypothetical protein
MVLLTAVSLKHAEADYPKGTGASFKPTQFRSLSRCLVIPGADTGVRVCKALGQFDSNLAKSSSLRL